MRAAGGGGETKSDDKLVDKSFMHYLMFKSGGGLFKANWGPVCDGRVFDQNKNKV